MRKQIGILLSLLMILICAAALADVAIDETNFPDAVFREYVRQFDTDQNGDLSSEERKKVNSISIGFQKLSDLKGIEHFPSLIRLSCAQNRLTALDVSHNLSLKEIYCWDNRLESLIIGNNPVLTDLECNENLLTSLDLSGCPGLLDFRCNKNKLKSLNLAANTKLSWLECVSNQLTSLDLSMCPNLRHIQISFNQIQSLNFISQPVLEYLECTSNRISELDLTGCSNLKTLKCDNNNLSGLDLSDCTSLTSLGCSDNSLSSLDVTGCKNLENLTCSYMSSLTSLRINGLTELSQVDCRRISIKELNIEGCTELNDLLSKVQWEVGDDGIVYSYGKTYLSLDKFVTIITDSGTIPPPEEPKKIEKMWFSKEEIRLKRTSDNPTPSIQPELHYEPMDASAVNLKWKSSKNSVATVDQDGVVTAQKKGTCKITCKAQDGSGIKATVTIIVEDKLVKSIKLNKKSATLKKGKTLQLEIKKIKPADAFNQKVKWSSSDKDVAKVDKKGKVKAVGKGECIITCEAKDGSGAIAKVKIKVK